MLKPNFNLTKSPFRKIQVLYIPYLDNHLLLSVWDI